MATARPSNRFRERFARLPVAVQEAVDEAILYIEANPREAGRELRGHWRGTWKRDVGQYRVLYRITGPRDQEVALHSVFKRPEGYARRGPHRPRPWAPS